MIESAVMPVGEQIAPTAAVNAALCCARGGRVVSRTTADGRVEQWCVGGQFDGAPVIQEI